MTSVTTKKLPYIAAEQLKESFYETSPTIGYVFIGNNLPYADENLPDPIADSIQEEKEVWRNIYAAKKITGNDVELVIPRYNWTANTKYRNYDDKIIFSDLLSTNTSLNLKPMYIMTSARNVYKCLSNNASANSTVEPTGDYTTSNGNISTADGYIWKYMFNVKPSNKFLTADWIPAPASTDFLDYGVSTIGVVPGELTKIHVLSSGSNYYEQTNVRVDGFVTGQTTVKLSNTSLILNIFNMTSLSNLSNLSISGTGIPTQTYIQSISNTTGLITLSNKTTASGGIANNYTIKTRVWVEGDGTGALTSLLLANNEVSKITVTTIGADYTRANVFIYGTGSGAVARAILPPKYGHARKPAQELSANSVMVSMRIGELDSTENGKISSNTTFRQYGLLIDPYKYGETNVARSANSVISQTTDLTIVAGAAYIKDEYVYQGLDPNNSPAYGFVNDQSIDGTTVKLTHVVGTFINGLPVIGANSGVSRTLVSLSNPEFEPETGDIVHVENITKTTRTDGQAENIKLIVRF